MSYKQVLIAIAFASAGTAFGAPTETFQSASQIGRQYKAQDLLGFVDYGNGNGRYTASWAKDVRFVAVLRNGQPNPGQPNLGQLDLGQPTLGQSNLGQFNFGQPELGQSPSAYQNITAPVPEPETYALMAAGLLLVVAAARRRRPR